MFARNGILMTSSLLQIPGICHGFSTRAGGVSTHPYTASMNLAMGREDDDDTVRRNGEIFASALSDGRLCGTDLVCASQIHSAIVRVIDDTNRGEGFAGPSGDPCDGFVTEVPGILPLIRIADCTPILMAGHKKTGEPVVGAVHAGWKGSGAGIVGVAVEKMVALGAVRENITAAIGPHIGRCCYEVGADLVEAVAAMAGTAFADRCCTPRGKGADGSDKFTADLTGMNLYWLAEAGVTADRVDISPDCTMCHPDLYHSHRATKGNRGAMGAAIGILA